MMLKRLYSGFRWVVQQPWLWLLVWLGALFALGHPQQSLSVAEAYDAQQARWMLDTHDWITLGWWGTPSFDRPPGLPWLIALAYHWFGYSELAVRLPAMVAAALATLLTWRLGNRLGLGHSGLWAAAILTVLPLWRQASQLGSADMVFGSLNLLMVWAILHSERYPRGTCPQQRVAWGCVAGIALGLGLLFQGLLGWLPLVALLPYLVRSHPSHHHLSNPGLYCGLGLGLVPAGVWLVRAIARYDLQTVMPLAHQWRWLALTPPPGTPPATLEASARVSYYLWQVPAATLPWIGFALVGAWLVGQPSPGGRRTLWLGYPLVILILLSVTEPREGHLALMLYPFLALLAAVGLNHLGRLYRSAVPQRYRVALGLGWLLAVLSLVAISGGAALILVPGELISSSLRTLGWVALLGGIGGLVPWVIALNRRRPVPLTQQWLWQGGWLIGPGLGLAAAFLTGLWGNYSPELQGAVNTGAIAATLAQNPIHMVQPDTSDQAILLTAYTPTLGEALDRWQDIPSEQYAWISGQLTLLDNPDYEVIGWVGDWQLVRASFDRSLTPRG